MVILKLDQGRLIKPRFDFAQRCFMPDPSTSLRALTQTNYQSISCSEWKEYLL